MSITDKIERSSRYPDSAKAWKALMNNISKKKRGGWIVVAYDPEERKKQNKIKADTDPSKFENNPLDWNEISKSLTDSFSKIIHYKNYISDKLDQVEMELCDCEHYCEFFKCDAARGYKLYAMIRECRIKRRFYKDELRKANSILNMNYIDVASGEFEKVLNSISNQTYKPRVLTELFDV